MMPRSPSSPPGAGEPNDARGRAAHHDHHHPCRCCDRGLGRWMGALAGMAAGAWVVRSLGNRDVCAEIDREEHQRRSDDIGRPSITRERCTMADMLLSNEPFIRVVTFVGIFAAMAAWEIGAPRREQRLGRVTRWPGNIAITVLDACSFASSYRRRR